MSGYSAEGEAIIVIDDDDAMRRACQAALRRPGYRVETFADGPSGLARIEKADVGLLIVDLKMPGMGGLEVIERVSRTNPDIVIIVITGFATVGTAVEAMKAGAYDFIPKPFTANEFRVIIARAVERRRLAMEAKRLRREKEAQARKFITFVSHQLQSPLGAVQQYLDVLRHQSDESIPAKYREWIDRSSRKIADMREVIQDWLTISKVEGGQLATERKAVGWGEQVDKVLETCATSAGEQAVTLHGDLPEDLPPVLGDATAMRMVLANLVTNGVKYNRPDGEVRVTASADENTVSLSVKDTGLGIAPEQIEQVFEEFFRIKDEKRAGIGGTGMGLPICRKIAEELGGRILVESTPGEGSTFTVVLPRASADDAASDTQP